MSAKVAPCLARTAGYLKAPQRVVWAIITLSVASAKAVAKVQASRESAFSHLMGFNPVTLPTQLEAKERNLGQGDLAEISSNVPELQKLTLDGFKLPSNFLLQIVPKPLVTILSPLVWTRPKVDAKRCSGCQTCVQNCPVGAMEIDSNIPRIDYKMCINCFCCSEICPEHAISLERSWLTRLFMK